MSNNPLALYSVLDKVAIAKIEFIQRINKMRSIIRRRMDYNVVGVLRGQRHIPNTIWPQTSSVFMLAMIDFHILWQMLLLSLSAPIWIRVRHHITTTKTKLSSHILIKLNYIVRFNLQYCGLIIKTIN